MADVDRLREGTDETVIYSQLRESELRRQLTASYCAAYRGLMDEAYLTSLQEGR